MKMLRDYFEYLLFEKSSTPQMKDIYKLKNLVDHKKAKWLVDVLVYLIHLDEYFDKINHIQLTNQWWIAKVEIELFIDSIIDRNGHEGLIKPGLPIFCDFTINIMIQWLKDQINKILIKSIVLEKSMQRE
jgi:hypothetical protein